MAEYEVNGVTYEFPDTYTPEQVKGILTAQGVIRGPTMREPEQVAAPPVAPTGLAGAEARQKVEAGAFRLTPAQEQEALRKAEEEARRKEGALVAPGGRVDIPRLPEEEPGMFERALSAIPEAMQTAYKFYKPEAQEDIRKVFERQEVATPEAVAQAEEQAKASGKPVEEYLPDALRLSIKGRETPLGATLRAITAPFTSAAEVTLREALTYDVDPATGRPVDPEDLSYRAEQAIRKVVGDENYPATLSTGGVLGLGQVGKVIKQATGFDPGEAPAAALREAGAPEWLAGYLSEGVTVPTFGPIDYGEGAAPDVAALDPYGLRKADTRLDWSDQIIRGARVDRGVKDLFVDLPEVRKAYKDKYGAESAAFYGGILVDMFVPDATMLVGPTVKGAKVIGKGADAALTGVAASRLYGGKVAREALNAARKTGAVTGEAVNAEVAKVVAREALAPRAVLDAIEVAGDVERGVSGLPTEVLRSGAGKWMVDEIGRGVDPFQAFTEVRVAQNMADVQRVWQAAVAAGKTVDEARQAALATARGVRGRRGGYLPPRIADALQGATTAADAARRVEAVVPRTAAPLVLGSPGSGAAVRNTLNLADDTLEGVGYAEAVAKVEDSVRKTLGELVPRDMVAVTSKVMVPRDLAPALRRAVNAELRGVMEVTPAGLRVTDAARPKVVQALERVYPEALRSDYWNDAIQVIQRGGVVPQDMATRLTDALQTDAYLRLSPRGAERLANVGRELDQATGTALQKFLAGNIVSRAAGAFTGRAKGVPGAYAAMGKAIGRETFGIPKRVADDVRKAFKAGEADPFRRVGEDLAAKAEDAGMGDNFVEEAWQNALEPLYGPLSQVVKDSIRAGDPAGLAPLFRNPPTLAALEEVDRALVGVVGEGAVRGVKDFGSALLSGLVEAEAWVTSRRVALEVIQDTPGLAVTLTPGLRGFTPDELPGLVSRALSDIMAQGTTRAIDPNWTPTFGDREYQTVLDAVGASLRAMGVNYLDGAKAGEVAARVITGIRPQGYELPGVVFIRPPELERLLNPESQKALAEGVEVLRRTKEGKGLVAQLVDFTSGAEQLGRSAAELAAGSNLVTAATNVLAMPVAIMAREGINKALGLTKQFALPRKDGLLFEAGGRPWTRATVDAEAARLGVGASTRLTAQRRGRLAADLMADLERTVGGNPMYRGTDLAKQVGESAGRIVPDLVDAAERRFRYLGFEEGLRRGMTPEQAADFSRDLLFDFEPVQLTGAARALLPVVTRAVEAPAAIRALVENPQEAVRIMRLARARQDYNERTYAGDEPLLEPVPGVRPLGGAALAWLSGVMADAYYGKTNFLEVSKLASPVKSLGDLIGGLSTFTEGGEDTPPDEVLNVMLLASMADRAGGKAGAVAGWDALVERYGLIPTNVTKDGVLPEYRVPAGVPTRMGAPPKGGEPVPMAYKMSPEGRKQFRADWERLRALSLGVAPVAIQAWQDTGLAPEVRVDQPMTPAATLFGEVRQATGR